MRRIRRRPDLRPPRYTVHSVAALAVLAVIVAGWGSAVPVGSLRLVAGAIWLPSRVGQVALISGMSGQPVAAVQVAPTGHDLAVVQSGPDGYVIDRTDGSVRRVSGATFDAGQAFTFADDGSRLRIFASGKHVAVLDGARGLAYRVDPVSLRPLGPAVNLSASVRPDAAVLDSAGRLWSIDAGTGDLTWLDRTVHRRAHVVPANTGQLVTVDGAPVLVGPTGAHWLASDGKDAAHVELGLDASDLLQVSGTDAGQLLVVDARRGLLDVCRRDGCGQAYPVPAGDHLGAAVGYDGVFVVPDATTGSVTIVSPQTPRTPVVGRLLVPSADFDLASRETFLFYNDPSSNRSGVVRLDGSHVAISKYDAKHPTAGLDTGASKAKPRTPVQPVPVPTKAPPRGPTPDPGHGARTGGSSPGPSGGPAAGQGGPRRPTTTSPTPPPENTSPTASTFDITGIQITPNPVVSGSPVAIAVSVTGGTTASCTWQIVTAPGTADCTAPLTAPAAGSYVVQVHAISTEAVAAGNNEVSLTVEAPPPPQPPATPTITGLPASCLGLGASATLTASDTSTVDSWAWTVDGTQTASGASYTFQSAQAGDHQISVSATRGTQSATSATTTIAVCDKTPPSGRVSVDGGVGAGSVTVTLTDQSHVTAATLHVEVTVRDACSDAVTDQSPSDQTGDGSGDIQAGPVTAGLCTEPGYRDCLDRAYKPPLCHWVPATKLRNVIESLNYTATVRGTWGCRQITPSGSGFCAARL